MDFSLTREQKDIQQAAREFAEAEFTAEKAHQYEQAHQFPAELYRAAGELGFVGLDYDEALGGGGLGVTENALVIEQFCRADSGIGMAIHLGFLPAKIVKVFGTDAQKKRWLAPVARGEAVSAVSFTEPDHGCDLTRMNTTVELRGDRWVINGSKIFTTNAAQADFFVVLGQDDPDARPGRGMTTVIVPSDPAARLGGDIEVSDIPGKMGLHMTSSGEVLFRDVEVPADHLLGERGRGLHNVLGFLDESRIEIAAQALGNAAGAFERALRHARQRTQFGQPIIQFQAIGHKVARMWSNLQSARWLTYHAAWRCDTRTKKSAAVVPLFTSSVKHQVPELAKQIIDDAMTVFGGYGYFLEQDVERRYRDNRIVEVYEGTVEVQLNTMVRILAKTNLDFLSSL